MGDAKVGGVGEPLGRELAHATLPVIQVSRGFGCARILKLGLTNNSRPFPPL